MTINTAGSTYTSSNTSRTVRAMLAAVVVCAGGGVFADDGQLLVTNSASLTSMQLSSVTPVQNVLPHVLHRGVNLDGSGRAGSAFGWRLNANSIGGGTVGGRSLNAVDLVTGSPSVTAIDLSLPAKQPWVVGRSFSSRQDSGGHLDSDGYQGRNWFQMSQPELVFEDEAADADDLVYLVYGADRYIEFRRVALDLGGYSSTEFRAVNGAAGVLAFVDGGGNADEWTYHDQAGNTAVFFGFDGDASPCEGQLWKVSDPGGNTAYVGDSSTASTAISNGYDSNGRIEFAYDSVDRRYSYTYSTIDSVKRLTEVKAETKTGGTWASPTGLSEVGKVAYGYYQTGDNTYGDNGNLELVTVTTPLTDSGISLDAKTYYRYWKGTFDDSTNPGWSYALQYIVEAEAYRQADWSDATFDDDPQSFTETVLKSYVASAFEYEDRDSMNDLYGRVDKAWFNGECGCSGGVNGTHEFTYETQTSGTWTSGYDTAWKYRAVVKRPDGTYVTQYFDEVGQALSKVITSSVPGTGTPDTWATKVVRDSMGMVTHVHTPENENGYTHDSGGNPDGSITSDTSDGLIMYYPRQATGDESGLLEGQRWKDGTSVADGSSTWSWSITRALKTASIGTNGTLNSPYILKRKQYSSSSTSKGTLDSTTAAESTVTVFGGDPLVTEYMERANVKVGTGENGSGSVNSVVMHFNDDGTVELTKSATGIIGYRKYNSFGLTESAVADANTTTLDTAGVTIPNSGSPDFDPYDFAHRGTPLHQETTYTYDAQGRGDETTAPDGDVSKRYFSKLADGRMVSISIPKVDGTTFYGPASYTVSNLAGKAEFSGTIALSTTTTVLTSWIDETKSDPIEALGVGSLSGVTVSVYNETGGTMTETRMYFEIPGSPDYLPGTDGTNYDATFYGYDDMGRRWRAKDATGTIGRTVFDDLGRSIERWTGTNDNSFSGGESSGTDNMVKVSASEYDSGNDGGNGLLTKSTLDPDGNWGTTADQRVTEYLHDARGRTIVTLGPQAPYSLVKYDEQGRVLAGASYTSSTGLDVGDDPESLATNRVSLSKSVYDAMGRSYESRVYQINQSTGAIEQVSSNDKHLRTLVWYDPEGRVMKTVGQQTSKTRYDRLGRATHRFVLANDNDTQYGDASATTAIWDSDDYETSVAGDKVATESQTAYEADTGRVLMSVSIERDHDDYGSGQTSGELDSNADGDALLVTAADLSGRARITAMWYDDLGRVVDTVRYGTNGGANFDRDPLTVPARSDTALRTTITYNDDGTRLEVEDPAGTKTRWEYDDARRVIATISNYVNGTPSSATGDDDNIVRQVYTDGLQTKLWVDLDGDNVEDTDDQVTTYTYGVTTTDTPGASSAHSGRLLRQVNYPDSTLGSDVVRFGYDALGAQVYTEDQAGTTIETDYDTAGRQLHRRATDTGTGIDTDVLRITMAYTKRGQVDTVTQYDNAAAGSGTIVDEVQFSYDQWGNVSKFDQDWNSAISGDSVDVDYTTALRQSQGSGVYLALRATGMTLPDGTSVTFAYDSVNGRHDNRLSRVSRVVVGGTAVARYEYSGVANLMGTELLEADLLYTRYNTSGTVDRLDNFGRVTDDIWTRGIDTGAPAGYEYYRDFYDTDIGWSRSSNIDLVEDNVYPNWDVAYTNDGLERLTQAERGVWGGSSITTTVHDELWTLSQTGNWEQYQLDLDGNGVFTGTNELDDDQTFNVVNELTARDTDNNGTDNYTLTYDAAGNLTDDGKDYEFIYDAFGRLVEVQNQSQQTVAEYTYNGLGYRTGWHYDVDGDGSVEANTVSNTEDPWFQFVYDARWRLTANYRASHYSGGGGWTIDADPKEQFVYHNAGLAGTGGSSYIDAVILRDRDANTAWESQADGTLEERVYYCQNWRADVVALMTDGGELINQVRYDPYGVPFGIAKTDLDADGDVDSADYTKYLGYYTASTMPYADWNWDGTKDTADITAYLNDKNADAGLGRGDPSYAYGTAGGANRKAYAGYEIDPVLTGSEGWESVYHVRNRVHLSQLGRWTRRDPLGYVDGMNLYGYASSGPASARDPFGLRPADGQPEDDLPNRVPMPGDPPEPRGPALIRPCPSEEPDPGDGRDRWVPDPNAWPATGDENDPHCGLSCWRSAGTGTQGGQQCCYDSDGSLNTEPDCMGTIDLWGVCIGEIYDSLTGNYYCSLGLWRVWRHWIDEVIPYNRDPAAYNEAQCCLRSCGVPSGTSGGGGVTDNDLQYHWARCRIAVAMGQTFCDGTNDCDDIDRVFRIPMSTPEWPDQEFVR
ncbi:MAG: RHS repeat-associated core domain-containing protein [Planctomycetota bacterium]|nr:RHS repeat-associated core domain-containing protein [Planctomycetota bacterium]